MTINIRDISEKDRGAVLHPFTHLKDFATGKIGDPVIVETGKGIRIQDATGQQLIDGFSGLYCVMINDTSDYRFDAMPFGGFKYGSMGREGVRFAYEDMTQPKVVCINQG